MDIPILKTANGGSSGNDSGRIGIDMEPTMPRKEQEYIDHILLASELMRDPNNFIIDPMEHPAVFPKSIVHVSSPTSNNANDFAVKDALSSELNFQTPLFQFVNKSSGVNGDAVPDVTSVERINVSATADTTPPDFMSINSDFLTSADNKSYCGDVTANHVESEVVSVPPFSSLSLLAEPNVNLNNTNDIMYTRANARKVLPHKKRISRKLKTGQDDDEPVLHTALEQHKLPEQRLSSNGVVGSINGSAMQFTCELCGHSTSSQLSFFAHLKQHYEPTNTHTILAAMKTTLDDLEPVKDCHDISAGINKKSVGGTTSSNNVEQVFNDVHNFANFISVDETVVRDVIRSSSQEHNMKLLFRHSIDKCMDYVSPEDATPLKDIAAVEVEFSDNEDMLEGIRNVVDKVSIEDTCDDIDLMTTTGIRAPLFNADNFSGIMFKSKPFGEVSFSGALDTEQQPISKSQIASNVTAPSKRLTAYATENAAAPTSATIYYGEDTVCLDTPTSSQPVPIEIHKSSASYIGAAVDSSVSDFSDSQSDEDDNAVDIPDADGDGDDDEDDGDDDDDAVGVGVVDLDAHNDAVDGNAPVTEVPNTRNNSKKRHPCTHCERQFNSRNALKYHLRTHTGVRPHQCDVCGYSFFAKGALKAHIRTHTGDKPFECEHCQRKFRQWGDLKYHIISIHTAEKSHQCEFCGKAFSRKYSLVLHRRIHTRERNYKCDLCMKAFRASSYLQNHRKIHTGEKPYVCNVCHKMFRLSGDLRRHMRIHQGETSTGRTQNNRRKSTRLSNGKTTKKS